MLMLNPIVVEKYFNLNLKRNLLVTLSAKA